MPILVVPKGESVSKLGRDRAKVKRREKANPTPARSLRNYAIGASLGTAARDRRIYSNKFRRYMEGKD